MAKSADFTAEQVETMAKRYMEGVSLTTLAKEFEVSIPTIRKYVAKGGAVIRPVGRPRRNMNPATVTTPPVETTEEVEKQETEEPVIDGEAPRTVVTW